jgi:transcriptional regulator with XRE-family HTH domain
MLAHRTERKNEPMTNTITLKIGAFLKQQRLTNGLSQEAIAEKIGISFQQIQKYENGSSGILMERFFDLAKALKFTPSEALKKIEGSQKPEVELDRESVELIKNYKLLKREHQNAVYQMIRVLGDP